MAGKASGEISEDRKAVASLFASSIDTSTIAPKCDVIFVYCHIKDDGCIESSSQSLREIIRDSGAAVVVVATENSAAAYIAAGKKQNFGNANLVMTLGRKGEAFGNFFQRLFSEMKKGISMPVAWVKLAPQGPDSEHSDCPDTIFACEVGQLAFR